jgi:hypothetical protein
MVANSGIICYMFSIYINHTPPDRLLGAHRTGLAAGMMAAVE